MSQELQTGIYYALFAGGLWGIGPLLLKRGLKYADVSTATLVTFTLARFTLKGIEVVTLRDGMAASLIVAGVFVLSRG
jgi:uncharacterized membrane protein